MREIMPANTLQDLTSTAHMWNFKLTPESTQKVQYVHGVYSCMPQLGGNAPKRVITAS